MVFSPKYSDDLNLTWLHRYPARFPIEAVQLMFQHVSSRMSKGFSIVLDPFGGSGTTLSASRQFGNKSIGIELSNLGVLLTSVRLYPPDSLEYALDFVERLIKKEPPKSYEHLPNELVNWIGVENACTLSFYLNTVKNIENSQLRSWLSIAISSALRPSSSWLPGSIKPQLDHQRNPPPLRDQFIRAARRLARDCELEASDGPPPIVIKGDARVLPLPSSSIDVVITSPPYGTTYDYFDVQRLTYLAFNWPQEAHLQIGRAYRISPDGSGFTPPDSLAHWYLTEYRGELTAEGRALRAYINDMRCHFQEVYRVVRHGGVIAYALANSMRKGRTFDLIGAITQIMNEIGFKDIQTIPREISDRRILPSGRDPLTGRFSSSCSKVLIQEKIVSAIR
jgi:DNA modification methylase